MGRVTIVGVGALGSHAVQLLRNVDATLLVIDMDRVEQKNTQSQFHGKSSVGKLKVQSLAQTMHFLFARKIEQNPNKLIADNVHALLGGSSLVVDCLDNGEGRRIIQGYVRKQGIPCLHGALSANGEFGRVVWDESFVIDDEGSVGGATCEDGEHLPFISIVSSYLAHAAKVFLTKGKKVGYSISPSSLLVI
jgi:predicted ThiF/HesA family dinucleotide-utilizing enzyme